MYDNSSRVIEVDINEILPNRFQPRIQFDEEEILELSDSIKEHGVIQPLVVRTIGDKYEIIAGERRYKASVLAGKETVPVIVKNLNDKDSAEIALIENIQRKNLTPIEEALSYKKILDMGYITQENLASKLGKSQSSVANKIRLLNLSDEVQEALLENKISERHARSLLKLSTSKQQNEMLDRIISERLTVRRADEEIEKIKNNPSDDSDDDTQKIIEKGEIDMNNNMFGMPSVPQNPQPTTGFDIFGTGNQQPVTQQPVMNTISEPVQQPVTQGFDIFGGSAPVVDPTPAVAAPMPTMESVSTMPKVQPVMPAASETPAMGGIQFDANGSVVAAPMPEVQPAIPTVPEVPVTAPIIETPIVNNPVEMTQQSENLFSFGENNLNTVESQPVMPTASETPAMGGIQFDANGNVIAAPMPTMESAPIMPEVQPVMSTVSETPAMGGIQFDANGNVIAAPMPTMESAPTMPEVQPAISTVPEVPVTAPIIETPIVNNPVEMTQQSENLFSFGENNLNTVESQPVMSTVPEFKMPEPIIVTDYSKQYDPIMPQVGPVAPSVDFKEVINAIRECSSKIEQYGFKIDVEEIDLANLYQVVFKIEK